MSPGQSILYIFFHLLHQNYTQISSNSPSNPRNVFQPNASTLKSLSAGGMGLSLIACFFFGKKSNVAEGIETGLTQMTIGSCPTRRSPENPDLKAVGEYIENTSSYTPSAGAS